MPFKEFTDNFVKHLLTITKKQLDSLTMRGTKNIIGYIEKWLEEPLENNNQLN